MGTAAALYFLLKPERMATMQTSSSSPVTVSSSDLGGIDADKLLASLKKKVPTVQAAYSYDKTHDPETKIGTTGGYVSGISFYDSRTGANPGGNYTSEAGGSIEVYKDVATANKRSADLMTEANVAKQKDSKASTSSLTRVDKFVVRASSKLPVKDQTALLSSLTSLAMGQLSSVGDQTNDTNPAGN